MNGHNEQNLKELFGKFLSNEQADKAVGDVQRAEQILREYPAPEPDAELIFDIKSRITTKVLHRRADVFTEIVYRATIVAAALMILTAIGLKLFDRGPTGTAEYASIIPNVLWESNDITADDMDLLILTAEIEQIEEQARTLLLGENGGNGERDMMELEIELVAIEVGFWKE